jgi:hypothetical protein
MALALTGCPRNQYVVQLKPRGNAIERTLVFYREDGRDANTGLPNYKDFPADELAAIASLYPGHGLTSDGACNVVRAVFTNQLPGDVGGAGVYTNLATTLGEAGFYMERFRGNDDLAAITENRFKAAGRLADLMLGWSQREVGREPGYEKLRQFLDVDFRRDLKNLSAYQWEGQLADAYNTNASEEFAVRFGQYLFERGYFTLGEISGLLTDVSGNDEAALLRRVQRLVARKMGVPETAPVPASLAFLADETSLEKSLDDYLPNTDIYRAQLKQWEKDNALKPGLEKPKAEDILGATVGEMLEIGILEGTRDHLVLQLTLPAAPVHSNGRWDATLKQVVWDADIPDRTNAARMPFSCYANWARADEAFQKEHLGKVALTGDELAQYCLWRSAQDARRGGEWDAFLAGLQPGDGLAEKLDGFRFRDEPAQAGANGPQATPSPSAAPRELLKAALGYSHPILEKTQ